MDRYLTIIILISGFMTGCCCQESPTPTKTVVSKQIVVENNLRGTVTKNWAEPMYDTIDVPGQIDPTNTYYRSPHKTVVEIRPGKYSGVQYDNETK